MTDADNLPQGGLVRLVDDDAEQLKSLAFLLRMAGFEVMAYQSAQALLEMDDPRRPGCLVLDIRMPGMSGLELQTRMKELSFTLPIIFVTGHGDVRTAVRTLKSGAFDFLEKPVDPQALDGAIRAACEISLAQAGGRLEPDAIRAIVAEMSPREREISALLAHGFENGDIAERLSLAPRTVQGHRNNIYHKLRVHNLRQFMALMQGVDLGA